ncbi:hypothetical protein PACTADRAFT_185491 [Pachysolen tannophilus NRRL Y-2460]|uniref:mRNA-capping enzyme subunit beta n=1 Tax=Pachysolen tannophilus NRRL Y-2460 TaxID=669874 RepID=A0A1E4U2G7_PACTA|nr:hypothetical protein PACTADRAFT_185491 [Pachysolen tannophilus NRRL Y-2460]
MDISNIITSDRPNETDARHQQEQQAQAQAQQQGQQQAPLHPPDLKPRLSINHLVNEEESPPPRLLSTPLTKQANLFNPTNSGSSNKSSTSSLAHSVDDIRARNSIVNITNEEDVDIEGNATPSFARRYSSSENNSPVVHKVNINGQLPIPSNTTLKKDFVVPGPIMKATSNTNVSNKQYSGEKESDNTSPVPKLEHDNEHVHANEQEQEISSTPSTINSFPQKNHEVKPMSIAEDIKLLNEITKKKTEKNNKPRRLTTPPIWATDWISSTLKTNKQNSSNSNSSRQRLRKTSTSLEALSISNVEPFNDLTRLISQWIYAVLDGIHDPSLKQFLEIELKLGFIWSKENDARLMLPVTSESILNTQYFNENCFFKSGIPYQQLRDLKDYLEMLNKSQKSRKTQFVIEKFKQKDEFFRSAVRNSLPTNARVTTDVTTNRIDATIDKKRLSDLFVYLPNSLFDIRISISLEIPLDYKEEQLNSFQKQVNLIRIKDRTSYIHHATFTRIDVTKVEEYDKEHGNKNKPPIKKCEVELEVDTHELLNSIESLESDPYYFEDLVKTFLDNGRLIARHLS